MAPIRVVSRFLALATLAIVPSAKATFHLMQVEQVIGGVQGDATAQAIQLRMRGPFQNEVSQARVRAWDAHGGNPVLVVDLDEDMSHDDTGDHVLIASPNFVNATAPNAVPDFFMTNLIPATYLAAGSLTFESDSGVVYWRLSWGGANYHGSTTGNTANDTDGNFGPSFAGPLPSTTAQALRFGGAASARSTTNAADYSVTASAAIFTNNAGAAFTVTAPPPIPGDVDGDLDVDLGDHAICAACLAGPDAQSPPSACTTEDFAACDLKEDGRADLADFAEFATLLTAP